jgi:ABC-2 type transport system permease protein
VSEFVAGLSALDHYNAFRNGVIGAPDVIYFLGLIAVSLSLAGVLIAERRGGGR